MSDHPFPCRCGVVGEYTCDVCQGPICRECAFLMVFTLDDSDKVLKTKVVCIHHLEEKEAEI